MRESMRACLVVGWSCVIPWIGSCGNPGSTSARHTPTSDPTRSPERFWQQFQSALSKKDVRQISELTHFPLKTPLSDIEGFEGIEHPSGFRNHFGSLFPDAAIEKLSRTASVLTEANRESVNPDEWTLYYSETGEISEEEDWAVIYHFSRTSDGSIRLTKVDFAG